MQVLLCILLFAGAMAENPQILSGGGSKDLHHSKLCKEAELLEKRNAEKLRRDSLTAEQKALALAEHKKSVFCSRSCTSSA